MRRLAAPVSAEVPAVRITKEEDVFRVHLPPEQTMSLQDFLGATLTGGLRFGLPLGARANVEVVAGWAPCWNCGAFTRVIPEVVIRTGPYKFSFSVPETGEEPVLFGPIYDQLPPDPDRGAIKKRYSRTQGRSYLSNGCAHCGALFGEFEALELEGNSDAILTTDIVLDQRWVGFLSEDDEDVWGIYESAKPEA